MLHNLVRLTRYRGLIQSLVARELKARYRGSVLGFFWSFIKPLTLLLIYTFVFTVVLPGAHPKELEPYALFMFCGILPWTWFSSSLLEASNVLISGGNLIKKVLFPAEVLPIVSVLANMLHFFLALPIVAAVLIGYRHWPDGAGLIWLPVVVLVQLVFTCGLALALAALTVHFRDIRDILANVLMLWFFSTPIIYAWYQEEMRPYLLFFNLNPFTHLAVSYQEILFFPGAYELWRWLLAVGALSIGVFLAGYWLFDRLRDSFAEVV
jgi:lipopolysaccharide transport system permease protein